MVSIADRLPDFTIAATREHLRRQSDVLAEIKRALDQLEKIRNRTESVTSQARANADFEAHYRRTLVQQLDRLEMFGLRAVGARTRMPNLSDTYIPLTAVPHSAEVACEVEEGLARQTRSLIRGEAGSGKTTLMQWLAVQAAQRGFVGPLADWNNRIPFYLRLREWVETDFPTPEHFLTNGPTRNVAGLMPASWAHGSLQRGLLLLDGVDEIPADRQFEWLEWLEGLVIDFPETCFVVSSRPAAIDAARKPAASDRLAQINFVALTLEPMSVAASEALISRWHRAVARDLTDEPERAKLSQYEHQLKSILHNRPAVRNLASTPLLCMMMCALNWLQEQRLPDERMKLYQQALDMLLESREAERQIKSAHVRGRFNQADREALLDALAYWMLRNGLSEASRDNAEAVLERVLPRLAHLQDNASILLQELLERSGVLRQPQHNTVDFIHRTFMEYMGAREAVANRDTSLLADRASTENWREVIVFAAGHARGKDRDLFVAQLLENPTIKRIHEGKRRLSVKRQPEVFVAATTAVCCLETVDNLDRMLLEKLHSLAGKLFPPNNFLQARLLAPAGASDPKLLKGHQKRGSAIVAACIRAASMIATEHMLDVIESYATVRGEIIDDEIARAFHVFDPDKFMRRVIVPRLETYGIKLQSELVAEAKSLFLLDADTRLGPRILGAVVEFLSSKSLTLVADQFDRVFRLTTVGILAKLHSLKALVLQGGINLNLLPYLQGLDSLKSLVLQPVHPVPADGFAPLSQFPRLRELEIEYPHGILPFADMRTLQHLSITNPINDWYVGIRFSSTLSALEISITSSGLSYLNSLGLLDKQSPINIAASTLPVVPPFEILPSSLRSLSVSLYWKMREWKPGSHLAGHLTLDLSRLADAPQLEELRLGGFVIDNATGLLGSNIKRVMLADCQGLQLQEVVQVLLARGCEVDQNHGSTSVQKEVLNSGSKRCVM